MNTTICHMTTITNLPNIIDLGGLVSKNELIKRDINFDNIANHDVQDKRETVTVPIAPGGNLHNYVPFYFWGQTPMLLVNKHRQQNIIFLASKVSIVQESGIPFVFTDRHAIVKYAKFSNCLSELNQLDWNAIKARYWKSDFTDPGKKEKKQAEFLIYEKAPWEIFNGIGVINNEVANKVTNIIAKLKHQPKVKIVENWYFL